MHRLASCLVSLVLISLPACKRDRDSNDPDPDDGADRDPGSASPSVEQVCQHLSDLAVAELGGVDPEIQRETVAMCTEEMRGEQTIRGPENWDGVARCVIAAQTDADIDRCDALYPVSGNGNGASAPGGGEKENQVCVVMVSVVAFEVITEAQAAGEAPPEISDDEVREAHAECMQMLDSARAAPGEDYDALLDCLASAESSAAFDQCLGG